MSCQGLIKALLFFVNFLFVIIGTAIFVVGVLGIIYKKQLDDLYPDIGIPNYVAPVIMIIGTIVFFISFSGCCGAIKEIKCLLVMYMVVMMLLAMAKIGIAVYIFMNKTYLEDTCNQILQEDKDVSPQFHVLEFATKCCGTTGPDFYTNANVTIPLVCCPVSISAKQDTCSNLSEDLYTKGCRTHAPPVIASSLNIATYSFAGIALFELLSMMAAMYLICAPRKGGEYYEYD